VLWFDKESAPVSSPIHKLNNWIVSQIKKTISNPLSAVPCIDRHYIGLNTKDILVFESAFATYVRGYDVKGKLLYPNRDALVSALMPRLQQTDFHCELVSRVYHDRGVIDEEHLFLSGKPFQAIWIYFEVVEDEITMFQYLKENDLNAHACL
jgi:hypothetical protein